MIFSALNFKLSSVFRINMMKQNCVEKKSMVFYYLFNVQRTRNRDIKFIKLWNISECKIMFLHLVF